MEQNKTIFGILTVVVAIILVGSVLAPVISDSSDSMKTVYNNGSGGYVQDGNDNYLFESSSNYRLYKINGVNVDVTNWGAFTVLFTDQCRISTAGHYIMIYGADTSRIWNYNASTHFMTFEYIASDKTLVCTCYNGLDKDSGIAQTQTYTVENIVYRIPGGDYTEIDTSAQSSFYVNSPDQIIAGGAYTSGNLDTEYFSQGLEVFVGHAGFNGSATVDAEDVAGYKDLLECSNYTVYISDGTDSEEFIPFSVFVPAEIKAYANDVAGVEPILYAIPLIVIVAILLSVIAIISKRE